MDRRRDISCRYVCELPAGERGTLLQYYLLTLQEQFQLVIRYQWQISPLSCAIGVESESAVHQHVWPQLGLLVP